MNRRGLLLAASSVGLVSISGCTESEPSEDTAEVSDTDPEESNQEDPKLLASIAYTIDERDDEVIVRLSAIQRADHIYVTGENSSNWSSPRLQDSRTTYKQEFVGQYLYTTSESGEDIGGVGTLIEYSKEESGGTITIRGVLDGRDSEIDTYSYLPRGESP
jgi:hypothetical protein